MLSDRLTWQRLIHSPAPSKESHTQGQRVLRNTNKPQQKCETSQSKRHLSTGNWRTILAGSFRFLQPHTIKSAPPITSGENPVPARNVHGTRARLQESATGIRDPSGSPNQSRDNIIISVLDPSGSLRILQDVQKLVGVLALKERGRKCKQSLNIHSPLISTRKHGQSRQESPKNRPQKESHKISSQSPPLQFHWPPHPLPLFFHLPLVPIEVVMW